MKNVITSAYFEMPSKLPHEVYLEHLKRFFRSIDSTNNDVVFFTSQKTFLRDFYHMEGVDKIHFVLSDFDKISLSKQLFGDLFERHQKLDIENHSPELARVWCEKMFFIYRAMRLFPARRVYTWCDSGAIRDDVHEEHLKSFGSRSMCNLDEHDNTLHLMRIHNIEKRDFYSGFDRCIAGALMYGNEQAWKAHIDQYRKQLMRYDTNDQCGSKDQHCLKSCVDASPENYTLHDNSEGDSELNMWFFFLGTL